MEPSSEPTPWLTFKESEQSRETQLAMQIFIAKLLDKTRTPTTIVVGYSDLLLTGKLGTLNEDQRKALVTINETGRALLRVFDELLEISQAQA
jgi:two-component system sensor histidine kinase/response regulator